MLARRWVVQPHFLLACAQSIMVKVTDLDLGTLQEQSVRRGSVCLASAVRKCTYNTTLVRYRRLVGGNTFGCVHTQCRMKLSSRACYSLCDTCRASACAVLKMAIPCTCELQGESAGPGIPRSASSWLCFAVGENGAYRGRIAAPFGSKTRSPESTKPLSGRRFRRLNTKANEPRSHDDRY